MLHLHPEKQPQSALSYQVTLKCRTLGVPNNPGYLFPSKIHIEWKTVFYFSHLLIFSVHKRANLSVCMNPIARDYFRVSKSALLLSDTNFQACSDHACSQNVVINVKKAQLCSWRQGFEDGKSQSNPNQDRSCCTSRVQPPVHRETVGPSTRKIP
jgi:hypothetical protein